MAGIFFKPSLRERWKQYWKPGKEVKARPRRRNQNQLSPWEKEIKKETRTGTENKVPCPPGLNSNATMYTVTLVDSASTDAKQIQLKYEKKALEKKAGANFKLPDAGRSVWGRVQHKWAGQLSKVEESQSTGDAVFMSFLNGSSDILTTFFVTSAVSAKLFWVEVAIFIGLAAVRMCIEIWTVLRSRTKEVGSSWYSWPLLIFGLLWATFEPIGGHKLVGLAYVYSEAKAKERDEKALPAALKKVENIAPEGGVLDECTGRKAESQENAKLADYRREKRGEYHIQLTVAVFENVPELVISALVFMKALQGQESAGADDPDPCNQNVTEVMGLQGWAIEEEKSEFGWAGHTAKDIFTCGKKSVAEINGSSVSLDGIALLAISTALTVYTTVRIAMVWWRVMSITQNTSSQPYTPVAYADESPVVAGESPVVAGESPVVADEASIACCCWRRPQSQSPVVAGDRVPHISEV